MKAQYTNNTSPVLAAIRRHIRKHGLGQNAHATLFTDDSIRITTYKKPSDGMDVVRFRLAVEDIVKQAGLRIDAKGVHIRTVRDTSDYVSGHYSRTAIFKTKAPTFSV